MKTETNTENRYRYKYNTILSIFGTCQLLVINS